MIAGAHIPIRLLLASFERARDLWRPDLERGSRLVLRSRILAGSRGSWRIGNSGVHARNTHARKPQRGALKERGRGDREDRAGAVSTEILERADIVGLEFPARCPFL